MSEHAEIIARTLRSASGKTAVAFVTLPVPSSPDGNEFKSGFGINFEEKDVRKECYGADGVQALYSALRHLRSLIERHNREVPAGDVLLWEGGMTATDLGLPGFDV
jgi:hypothetical protein